MPDLWTAILIAARISVLLLGVSTTVISYRAFRRSKARYLRDATLGFGMMTVGVFIEGLLYQFASLELVQVHVIESVAIGLGFVILLRSFLE